MLITPLNIILLLIIVFIIFRLRSVLGMRNEGDEEAATKRQQKRLNRLLGKRDASSVKRADKKTPSERAKQSEIMSEGRGLQVLKNLEPNFDEAQFIEGAMRAYRLILQAFAEGDSAALAPLLGDEVRTGFESALTTRSARGQKLHTEIVDMKQPIIEDILVEGGHARVSVCFEAQLVSALYERDGELSEGESANPRGIRDIWVFERAIGAQTPNWILVETDIKNDDESKMAV